MKKYKGARLLFLVVVLLLAACDGGTVPIETTPEPVEITQEPVGTTPKSEPEGEGVLSVPLEGDALEEFLVSVAEAGLVEDPQWIVEGSAAGLPYQNDNGFALQGAVISDTENITVTTEFYGVGLLIGVLLIDDESLLYAPGKYQVVNTGSTEEPELILHDPEGQEFVAEEPEYHQGGVPGTQGEVVFVFTEFSPGRCGWWIFCIKCSG
jgi:hypothetical protein